MDRKQPLSRRRPTGWVELSVALAALVVSGASLYIARQQTSVMDRQLAASIWPAIQLSTSNLQGGQPVITLSIENVGVGPARIHSFRVLHQGRTVGDLTAFVAECCAAEEAAVSTITSFVAGRILPANTVIDFLTLPADPNHPEIYQRFNRVRGELEFELCYCSVLEQCWVSSGSAREPEPVRACPGEPVDP